MSYQHKEISSIELTVGVSTYELRAPNFGDSYRSMTGITINPIKDRKIIFRRATVGIQYDILTFVFSAVKNYPSFITWLETNLGEAMTLDINFLDNDGSATLDQYQGTILGDILVVDTDDKNQAGYCSAEISFTFEAV